MLCSAIAWASYTILSKKYLKLYNSSQYSAFISVVGVVGLVIIGPRLWLKLILLPFQLLDLGHPYSGVLSVGLAYLIWNRGVHKFGAIKPHLSKSSACAWINIWSNLT